MDTSLIFLVLMLVAMYVFMFLPQIRKQKKQKKFITELKKGDKVVTTGGIHGKIAELKDLTAVIDLGGGTKMKVNRAAISMEASTLENSSAEDTK